MFFSLRVRVSFWAVRDSQPRQSDLGLKSDPPLCHIRAPPCACFVAGKRRYLTRALCGQVTLRVRVRVPKVFRRSPAVNSREIRFAEWFYFKKDSDIERITQYYQNGTARVCVCIYIYIYIYMYMRATLRRAERPVDTKGERKRFQDEAPRN